MDSGWSLFRPRRLLEDALGILTDPFGLLRNPDYHRGGRNPVADGRNPVADGGILPASSPQGKGTEAPWRLIIKQQAKRTAEIRHLAPRYLD